MNALACTHQQLEILRCEHCALVDERFLERCFLELPSAPTLIAQNSRRCVLCAVTGWNRSSNVHGGDGATQASGALRL